MKLAELQPRNGTSSSYFVVWRKEEREEKEMRRNL